MCLWEGICVDMYVCVLERAPCWYFFEMDVWGTGSDWVLHLGKGGILRYSIYITLGHS